MQDRRRTKELSAIPAFLVGALLLIALLFSALPARAADKILIGAGVVALGLDYLTTTDIENHPDRAESNPYLGKHPDRGDINRYFGGLLALHLGGNWLIGKIPNANIRKFARSAENFSVIITHGTAAAGNFSAGLSVNW